jgi:RNA 2',3'-cyclic 3'-phosphodiesterase
MPKTTRTFVAIEIPSDRAVKLGKLQTQIAARVEGARWIDPKQLHATLAFLGDVADTDLDRVCRAVTSAAAAFPAIELRLEGLGAFPGPTRPRSIWVGLIGPGLEPLKTLYQAVSDALAREGYPPDGRFTPHVTLARLKARAGATRDLSTLLREHRGWTAGAFVVSEIVTFSSTLTPEGPVHAPMARGRLLGRKPDTQA